MTLHGAALVARLGSDSGVTQLQDMLKGVSDKARAAVRRKFEVEPWQLSDV
jgi:hypothetical protein